MDGIDRGISVEVVIDLRLRGLWEVPEGRMWWDDSRLVEYVKAWHPGPARLRAAYCRGLADSASTDPYIRGLKTTLLRAA